MFKFVESYGNTLVKYVEFHRLFGFILQINYSCYLYPVLRKTNPFPIIISHDKMSLGMLCHFTEQPTSLRLRDMK